MFALMNVCMHVILEKKKKKKKRKHDNYNNKIINFVFKSFFLFKKVEKNEKTLFLELYM